MKNKGCLVAVVIVGFIVLVNLAAWLLGPGVVEDAAGGGSSFSNSPAGLRGLALLYAQNGLSLAQRRQPFDDISDLDARHDTLIIACPQEEYSDRELANIERWVNDGGQLVLIEPARAVGEKVAPGVEWTPPSGVNPLDRGTPTTTGTPTEGSVRTSREGACYIPLNDQREAASLTSSRPVALSPLTFAVSEVVTPVDSTFSRLGSAAPAAATGKDYTLAVARSGRGEVVLISANAFSNVSLADGNNARLALNLIGGRRAVFDEYHHGFRQSGGSLLAMPVQWRLALAALITAALAYAWAKAPRRSPPLEDPPILPRARGEFIDAVASSLKRADGSVAAVRILQDDLRNRLRRQLFVRGASTDQRLVNAAAAAGFDPRRVAAALAPIEADDLSLLNRAQAIASLRRELK